MPESRENREALSRIVPGYTQIFLYNGTDKVRARAMAECPFTPPTRPAALTRITLPSL
jgi:hypothetical protein